MYAGGGTFRPTFSPQGSPISGGPAQPSLAAANGFNTLTLWDDFLDTSSIDLNATGNPGYKWYTKNFKVHSFVPLTTPASAISVSNSVLTLHDPANYSKIQTVGYLGTNNPRTVGNTLSPGGYIETKFSYSGNQCSVWNMAVNGLLEIVDGAGSNPFGEVDVYEGDFGTHLHDWTAWNATTQSNNASLQDFSTMHTMGVLWLTQAQNSGTGIVKWYYNGSHITGADITYSSGGTSPEGNNIVGEFSILDSGQFVYTISCGANSTMNVDYVMIWQ